MPPFPLFPPDARHPMAAASIKLPALSERLLRIPEVTPAARLEVRPTPEIVPSGIDGIDALTGGLPRGRLTEVFGSTSSGRTSLALATLATATRRQEACALVDVSDAFDPASAAMAGVQFERLLWVRCGAKQVVAERRKNTAHGEIRGYGIEKDPALKGRKKEHYEYEVEQALRVTDLLLQSGGFGLVMIDFGDVPFKIARRIPLTSWFRFQRAVEHTPTVLFVITPAPCTQSCATLLLKVQASEVLAPEVPAHTQLLDSFQVQGELLRSRLGRKPPQSATAAFATKIRTG